MAERYMARALLPLAWALLTCDCTPYGASILDSGLGYLIFAIKWLHILWREYHCLWLGLIHLWSHSNTPYDESVIALGLGYLNFAIV